MAGRGKKGGAIHRPVTLKRIGVPLKVQGLSKRNTTRRNIFKNVNFSVNSREDPFEYLKKTRKFFKSISDKAIDALNEGKQKRYEKYLLIASLISSAVANTFKNHSKVLKNTTDELLDLFAGLSVGSNIKDSKDDLKELMDETLAVEDPIEYIDNLEDYIEDFIDQYEGLFDEKVDDDKINKMSIFASILAEDIQSAIEVARTSTTRRNVNVVNALNMNMNTKGSPVSVNSSINNNRNNKNTNKNIENLSTLFSSTFANAFGKK